MEKKRLTEYRLSVGDTVIGIICPTEEYAESMKDYFSAENADREADISLNLHLVPHTEKIEIPDSLFNSKAVINNKFNIGHDLVHGIINSNNNSIDIWVKACLTIGPVTRVFEQIIYQAFYNARKIIKSDSFLVHSSGVIYNGKGYLFVGASGSGKSTIADISKEFHVLNDEICLISYKNDKAILHSTPFNGYYENKKSGNAILEAIFFLEHGNAHKIVEIKKSEAVKISAKEIVPPIGLNELINSSTFIEMIDIAEKLYQRVQMRKLEFLPNKALWDEIDKN